MSLGELSTLNFRNLSNQTFKFNQGITVFFGDNAQGKTNILEAVYLLATGKSFRTRSDHELITWGHTQARVFGKAENLEPEVIIYPDKKEFLVNKQSKRQTDLIGSFIVVVFTPRDIEIVAGPPDKRRRFLDQVAANLDKKYLYQLISYNKILRNRNQILLQMKQGRNHDLTVWNTQLSKAASFLWHTRKELINKVNHELKIVSQKIVKTALRIEYDNLFIKETRGRTEDNYLNKLNLTILQDKQKTTTQMGPHRDDFKIISEEEKSGRVVSKDLTIYGSRGEQRAAALSLKLSEVSLLEKELDSKPTLLLDEVLSELDFQHRKLLLNQLRKHQVLITSTTLDQIKDVLPAGFSSVEIADGQSKKT